MYQARVLRRHNARLSFNERERLSVVFVVLCFPNCAFHVLHYPPFDTLAPSRVRLRWAGRRGEIPESSDGSFEVLHLRASIRAKVASIGRINLAYQMKPGAQVIVSPAIRIESQRSPLGYLAVLLLLTRSVSLSLAFIVTKWARAGSTSYPRGSDISVTVKVAPASRCAAPRAAIHPHIVKQMILSAAKPLQIGRA